jgi:hypothetical protein
MKSIYIVMAILASVTIIGVVAISTQQVSAFGFVERQEFKKLTKDLEKAILDIGAQSPPDPDKIQTLLDDYNDDVMALFRTPSTSP